jgi:hypothetical protein
MVAFKLLFKLTFIPFMTFMVKLSFESFSLPCTFTKHMILRRNALAITNKIGLAQWHSGHREKNKQQNRLNHEGNEVIEEK